jgi:hypothetical protein
MHSKPRNSPGAPALGGWACYARSRVRPLKAQLLAAVTALAVLLSSGSFAQTRFFCTMMNRVVATCCCEARSEPAAARDCATQVRSPDCCEKVSAATRAPTLKATGTEVSVPPAAVVATISEPVYELPRVAPVEALPRQARAPPIVGPPLFIAHCSLLT